MNDTVAPVVSPRRRLLLTIVLAYAGFVALGLANSVMGVAWPSVRATFGMPIDALGIVLIGNTAGYMIASASSGRLIARLHMSVVLALSCGIVAVSLIGSGSAPAWLVLVLLSFTTGLGAGAIDAGLNAYAAEHFSARAMNWLHACFGIGATLGPAIMTAAVASPVGWRAGFWAIGIVQLVLAIGFSFTRSLWQRPGIHSDTHPGQRSAPLTETLQLPVAWLGILLFFVYTGAEIGVGQWVYSLLTEARGVSSVLAGTWISLYWASLTVGRVLFGFVVHRIAPVTLLRWSMVGAVLSALLIWLNITLWLTFVGIALMGVALAPQFPLLISATPDYLGARHAANGVGFQVAAASLGGALLPSLIGVLARADGLEVLGPFLTGITLVMTLVFEVLARRMQKGERQSAG
ncbi:MAG TPA: MFS transporter [Roseiflexaceae bacterium]|jgi:fucose permease|nr:MFS transporter [Roseiflexaceae bacterium]